MSKPLLRELRDWAKDVGDPMLVWECTIGLNPADHKPEDVQTALQRCADAWNERVRAAHGDNSDDPTVTRVPTAETTPMKAVVPDEDDIEAK